MTNDKRVEEIRERLAKATPGPWERDPFNQPSQQVIAKGNQVISYHHRHNRQDDHRIVADHELMAHAPADLAFLLSELDRARKVVEASRNLRQFSMRKTEDLIGNLRLWVELEGALDAALSAADAPTENK